MRWLRPRPVAVGSDFAIRTAEDVPTAEVVDYCAERAVEAALICEPLADIQRRAAARDFLVVTTPAGVAGVCWIGGNVVPVGVLPSARAALASQIYSRFRRYSSVVGAAQEVLPLWEQLEGLLPKPRSIREDQPSLVMGQAQVAADPAVRMSLPGDFAVLLPAAVHMFTEEVGYSPLGGGGYERRLRSLIASGRSFSRIEDGRVIFKAEVGALGLGVAQLQGVWVNPDLRGRGLAAPGVAAAAQLAAGLAPTVSLYVNSFNERAVATYRRVGFQQVGTYATVLL